MEHDLFIDDADLCKLVKTPLIESISLKIITDLRQLGFDRTESLDLIECTSADANHYYIHIKQGNVAKTVKTTSTVLNYGDYKEICGAIKRTWQAQELPYTDLTQIASALCSPKTRSFAIDTCPCQALLIATDDGDEPRFIKKDMLLIIARRAIAAALNDRINANTKLPDLLTERIDGKIIGGQFIPGSFVPDGHATTHPGSCNCRKCSDYYR